MLQKPNWKVVWIGMVRKIERGDPLHFLCHSIGRCVWMTQRAIWYKFTISSLLMKSNKTLGTIWNSDAEEKIDCDQVASMIHRKNATTEPDTQGTFRGLVLGNKLCPRGCSPPLQLQASTGWYYIHWTSCHSHQCRWRHLLRPADVTTREVREVPFTVGRRACAADSVLVKLFTRIVVRSSRNFVSTHLLCNVSCQCPTPVDQCKLHPQLLFRYQL